jgi:hypothetical protein
MSTRIYTKVAKALAAALIKALAAAVDDDRDVAVGFPPIRRLHQARRFSLESTFRLPRLSARCTTVTRDARVGGYPRRLPLGTSEPGDLWLRKAPTSPTRARCRSRDRFVTVRHDCVL